MKLRFYVRDFEGRYVALHGTTVLLKDIPNQGSVFHLVAKATKAIEEKI